MTSAPLPPEEIARLREAAEAATATFEAPWPRRNIDREGTCDSCAETKRLVAAYDDPAGDHEPWLCEECAHGTDFAQEVDPPTVLRLLATAEQHAALVEAVAALADEWQENAAANEHAGHFPWAMWQNRANELRALVAEDGAS